MLKTCVGHAFSRWDLGNLRGGFIKRKKWEVILLFSQRMVGQWKWHVFLTRTAIYMCVCVCVYTQKLCSSQAQKRGSSKVNACYHKPWLQQCFSSGPSPDATCIYTALALHDGCKICLATQHGKKCHTSLNRLLYIYIYFKKCGLAMGIIPTRN